MKNIKRLMAMAMIGALSFSIVGCKMIEKTPEAIQKEVVATVGKEKITKGDVDKEVKPYLDMIEKQYGTAYKDNDQVMKVLESQKTKVLDTLVAEKVLIEKAKELNLVPAEDELNKEVDESINNMKTAYGTEEAFTEAKKTAGYEDDASFREFIKNQVIAQKAMDYMFKDITTTDEDVKKNYDENIANYSGANVAHILIADEAKANEVRARVAGGEDFATVAKEVSEDPGSKETGGDLGYVPYNSTQLVPEFMEGFKNLKEGEISQPVKSEFGYHIIKATNVGTKSFDEVKETIKTDMEKQAKDTAYTTTMEQWKKDLNVKTYPDKL